MIEEDKTLALPMIPLEELLVSRINDLKAQEANIRKGRQRLEVDLQRTREKKRGERIEP